jgi:hypothetical protein
MDMGEKPLTKKEANRTRKCAKEFCSRYYVPAMEKKRKGPTTRKQKNVYCKNTFCGTKPYNLTDYPDNFHMSIPLTKVRKLKRFGALSGFNPNKYIL